MSQPCQRCHTLTPHLSEGLLRLCGRCVLQAPCAAFQHDYRGSATPGVWGCLRCGAVLASQALRSAPAPAAPDPVMDWYC